MPNIYIYIYKTDYKHIVAQRTWSLGPNIQNKTNKKMAFGFLFTVLSAKTKQQKCVA